MATVVHGFREYFVTRCRRTGEIVARGKYGMHVHENPAPRAKCNGISAASWLTPKAKEILKRPLSERKDLHDPLDVPYIDCTDGYYTFRRYRPPTVPINRLIEGYHIASHVTAIGKCIIHEEGARVQSYRIDYFIAPRDEDAEIYIYAAEPSPDYPYYWPSEHMKVVDALRQISSALNVPVLDYDDPKGCAVCQVANGWVRPEQMEEIVLLCDCRSPSQDEQYGSQMRVYVYLKRSRKWRCSSCGRETEIPILETETGQALEVKSHG